MDKINERSVISTDLKTIVALIAAACVGLWAFFGIQEKLNKHSTELELMEKDLIANTEFRIKWPRGLLGSLPMDAEQFMLIEMLSGEVEKIQRELEESRHNAVNIKRLQADVEEARANIEKLKDKVRQNGSATY
jgi:hypothetical protein